MRKRAKAVVGSLLVLWRWIATVVTKVPNYVVRWREAPVAFYLPIGAVALVLAWRWSNAYVSPSSPEERISLLQTTAQIVGGAILAAGLWVSGRTLRVNWEGQITERFTRAVDQLGSERLEVRLGGVYALERIARDSTRDHRTVVEVLTAYVRERSPWPPRDPDHEVITWSGNVGTSVRTPPLLTDIQAALTAIGRREQGPGRGEPLAVDLSATDLRGYDLSEAHLERANLWKAHLDKTGLWNTHMNQANLRAANLADAYLAGANLSRAVLASADLSRANLNAADLSHAVLLGAKLDGADLLGADLSNAKRLEPEQVNEAYWYDHGATILPPSFRDELAGPQDLPLLRSPPSRR